MGPKAAGLGGTECCHAERDEQCMIQRGPLLDEGKTSPALSQRRSETAGAKVWAACEGCR